MTTEQRLERENRWMRRIGAVGVAVAAAVFLVGQGKEATGDLEGSRLVLRDGNGQKRVDIGAEVDGKTFAALLDSRGETRLTLMVSREGSAGIAISGAEQDKQRLDLGVLASEKPFAAMSDANGEQRLILGVLADGQPFVTLSDADGNQRAKLALLDGAPRIRMKDSKGRLIWKAPND